jgi:hypothetical protein
MFLVLFRSNTNILAQGRRTFVALPYSVKIRRDRTLTDALSRENTGLYSFFLFTYSVRTRHIEKFHGHLPLGDGDFSVLYCIVHIYSSSLVIIRECQFYAIKGLKQV